MRHEGREQATTVRNEGKEQAMTVRNEGRNEGKSWSKRACGHRLPHFKIHWLVPHIQAPHSHAGLMVQRELPH